MKGVRMKTFILFFLMGTALLLSVAGCSTTSSETVGLRIFNPVSRFHDDEVYFDLIDPADDTWVVVNLIPDGHWWPAQVHRLKKGVPLILRVRYEGAAISDQHIKHRKAEYLIDMRQDYDVTVHWTPFMSRPSLDEEDIDFDWGPHWARQPEFELSPGHEPMF